MAKVYGSWPIGGAQPTGLPRLPASSSMTGEGARWGDASLTRPAGGDTAGVLRGVTPGCTAPVGGRPVRDGDSINLRAGGRPRSPSPFASTVLLSGGGPS